MTNLIGYHFSTQGGFLTTIERYCNDSGLKVGQIFLSSPQRYGIKNIPPTQTREIKQLVTRLNLKLFVHAGYLVNLARPPTENKIGLNSLFRELKQAASFGARGVVFHVGKAKDLPRGKAIENMITSICEILSHDVGCDILLESSAGVGTEVGSSVKEFASIYNEVVSRRKTSKGFGICLDTAHLHSSGIDIRTRSAAKKFLRDFNRQIGFKHVKLIHFNDSERELGSCVDRHETLMHGYVTKMGKSPDGLRTIALTAKQFGVPMILERNEKKSYLLDQELEILKGWVV